MADEFMFEMESLDFCPICGSKEIVQKANKSYPVKSGEHIQLVYWECKSCTHQFMSPRPTKASYDALYSTGAYRKMIDQPGTSEPSLVNYAGEAIRGSNVMAELIPRIEKSELYATKIADIGGSTGMALYILGHEMKRTLGLDARLLNVEPDKTFAMEGHKVGVASVRSIEEAKTFAPFDLVLCIHTFEHQNNALEFLKEIMGLGSVATAYYIEVPHVDTPGQAYSLFHPHAFSKDSLAMVVEQAGLKRMFHKYRAIKGKMQEQYILAKPA